MINHTLALHVLASHLFLTQNYVLVLTLLRRLCFLNVTKSKRFF